MDSCKGVLLRFMRLSRDIMASLLLMKLTVKDGHDKDDSGISAD